VESARLALSRVVFAIGVAAALASGGAFAQAPVYDIDIAEPTSDQTVFSDTGDVDVRATVAPDQARGYRVEFLIDGQSAGNPSSSLDAHLNGIVRGQHVVQARLVDSAGNVAALSPPTVFYVWQASMIFPNRHGH
jgi:hypothetical protein